MEEEKKTCCNCAHYLQHYYICSARLRLVKAICGHCSARRVSSISNKKFPFERGCEKWQKLKESVDGGEKISAKLECIESEILPLLLILREQWEK